MKRFYRVHPRLPGAVEGEPGSPSYVPPGRATGRIGNEEYDTLYVSDSPVGAIAEAFGNYDVWTEDLFEPPATLPGYEMVLSTFQGELEILDLNDPVALSDLGLVPSRVVTRHRSHTQAWALAVYLTRQCSGVRWWSYHDPDWGSLGLWDTRNLSLVDSERLTANHPAVIQARKIMHRRFVDADSL